MELIIKCNDAYNEKYKMTPLFFLNPLLKLNSNKIMFVKMKYFFPNKGFILTPAIIILAISLVSALSVVVFLTFKKDNSSAPDNSVATEQSANAFQVANSGSEAVLEKIYKEDGKGDGLADLTALAEQTQGACSDGVISGSTPVGNYKVSLYDAKGTQLKSCSDGTWRSQVAQIKSEGTSNSGKANSSIIKVAVAAEPTPGITGGCVAYASRDGGPVTTNMLWGSGCRSIVQDPAYNGQHDNINRGRRPVCEVAADTGYSCGYSSTYGETGNRSFGYSDSCFCVKK
jgi:hypothetical protein